MANIEKCFFSVCLWMGCFSSECVVEYTISPYRFP
ncbi:hypothetical protein EVA_15829 [gut metagenome]|uniref:Uncharacterized protein n=1 Tax=gut metagenome TaxID=749906 RepID=J9FMD2_9ZZZZ